MIPTLQAEGHQVIAAQYDLDTLAGDVATVKRLVDKKSRIRKFFSNEPLKENKIDFAPSAS